MIREQFKILLYDLSEKRGKIVYHDGRNRFAGGSGLAALLFIAYGRMDRDWNAEEQPLILTIGPLTGLFPLMSKMVCAFKSPYHNQYTESHGGGRAAFALRFADLDAIVITGKAKTLCCLSIGSNHIECRDVGFMRGMNALSSGRLMRKMFSRNSGHRSILRIGQSGESGSAMACINIDTYRHFGRLGGGAVMGDKNLKGIIIHGDSDFNQPEDSRYAKLYQELYDRLTATDMMHKYFDLGTPANLEPLNELQSLPWKNLQKTSDPAISKISGESFADDALLRNGACSGCPVGCIHIGYFREKSLQANRYHFHQVAYDYEPIFAAGSMLGVTESFDILRILDTLEKVSLDAMSGGVALAWATEASERGLISENETLVPLRFGGTENYIKAAAFLGKGINDFYRTLGQGTLKAAQHYGGTEFACVLGQEMAGYATGELFFASQALGFRHSHLDTGAYSWDQKHTEKDVDKAVSFLLDDEPGRVLLTSMVACLFARSVYTGEILADCLTTAGYGDLASSLEQTAENIRKLRWQVRFATGFQPEEITIPKRFYSVTTWKGKIDREFLDELKSEYGRRLLEFAEPLKID
ncbi:aldehyde ferredoxin oxidoreductase N-terminal domain-containing protein [Desulfopila inferna]|uniref:aldehyde ferredoxin oxidoreductase N-terminal domain-containing protein n=1 Tax=Desulfopila inferna TaxID=468528 RepID=UPI001965DAFE|nr:aldehyde ferredoxin oxidoreductase N-terminal domain-containing protein [Desulfopila inferna]MBM9604914.1 aldehyde ferredoxin oxidoreductase [Desulfopila inferna]